MFNQLMHQNMVQQDTNERNLSLEQGNAKLEANVDKLRYQLRQKTFMKPTLKRRSWPRRKSLKLLTTIRF